MNRKDIIIVSVLVNAGLLVVLFVSALNTDKPLELAAKEEVALQAPEIIAQAPTTTPAVDQIDQVLKQYSSEKANTPLPEVIKTRKVTVKKGDFLEKIAKAQRVSVDEIMRLNNLSSSRLQIGQVLQIPLKSAKAPSHPLKKQVAEGDKYYIVKGGDNPWTIALKNQMQVDDLLKLNNMDEEKAKRLRPGDRLRIK